MSYKQLNEVSVLCKKDKNCLRHKVDKFIYLMKFNKIFLTCCGTEWAINLLDYNIQMMKLSRFIFK